MKWWWGKQREKTPVYTEAGEVFYRMLTERSHEWSLSGSTELSHYASGLRISDTFGLCWFYVNRYTHVCDSFSKADKYRLKPLARQLIDDLSQRAVVEQGIKINSFDETAKSLARAVLSNNPIDRVAARALADRVQELAQEGAL